MQIMKTKNNYIGEIITNDINSLAHYGVQGQKWYVNQAERYQNHAKYAKGSPRYKARKDALQDYYTREGVIKFPTKTIITSIVSGILASAAVKFLAPYEYSPFSFATGLATSSVVGNTVVSAKNKKAKQEFDKRHNGKNGLKLSNAAKTRLSPAYVDEYSKTIDYILDYCDNKSAINSAYESNKISYERAIDQIEKLDKDFRNYFN